MEARDFANCPARRDLFHLNFAMLAIVMIKSDWALECRKIANASHKKLTNWKVGWEGVGKKKLVPPVHCDFFRWTLELDDGLG